MKMEANPGAITEVTAILVSEAIRETVTSSN